jgi:hypothetical protein
MYYEQNKIDNIDISYITLRRLIGILGMLLPFICVIGSLITSNSVEDSISSYYHTNMRDIFVGVLVILAVFLITYRFERIDNIISTISGFAALGIAIFPNNQKMDIEHIGLFQLNETISGYIHVTCASIFFILLAYHSYFLFTKSNKVIIEGNKKIRNLIFRGSGIIIILSILSVGIMNFFLGANDLEKSYTILIFETIMLLAFGISWLVKGETLFKD